MNKEIYPNRYIARFIIEAETPLKISSGESEINIDQTVCTDANGLPYIPGTSLTGVLRASLEKNDEVNNIFGYLEKNKPKEESKTYGSRLIVSSAHFVGKSGKTYEGLLSNEEEYDDEYIKQYQRLPLRQHVRISHLGTNENAGKFDEQVVYKGCRFCFELILEGNESDEGNWDKIINIISSPLFRIGGGSRKGFGEIKVVSVKTSKYDLSKEQDLNNYINRSASLNSQENKEQAYKLNIEPTIKQDFINYRLELQAHDMFLFSSGSGSKETDMNPVTETYVIWDEEGNPSFTQQKILIPASSIKGAISHRLAYNYNLNEEKYADEVEKISDYVGEKNKAVNQLLGKAENDEGGRRGIILFSDVHLQSDFEEKNNPILNHVKIDRFTGGATTGALFNERACVSNETIKLEMNVLKPDEFKIDKNISSAFVKTLKDICSGSLPLGGGTMRGHGRFTGKLYENGKEIYNGR